MERKITALKAQKRNQNRVSVYLDGEFAFGLARIVAAWLHVGQTINEQQILKLQSQDTVEVAFQKALRHLSYRPRSEAEVRQKLDTSGYTEAVIETVITRLLENKLIHDPQFAQMWIENRSTFRPRSRRV
jgi:regulatory protein